MRREAEAKAERQLRPPSSITDGWVGAGSDAETRFTWDLQRNDNKSFDGFKPRARYDRFFVTPCGGAEGAGGRGEGGEEEKENEGGRAAAAGKGKEGKAESGGETAVTAVSSARSLLLCLTSTDDYLSMC